MTLVTRFSAFFLLTLALVLGGFSACIFALMSVRLHQGLDRELATALDQHEAGAEPVIERASWALFDDAGRRLEGSSDEPGNGPFDRLNPGALGGGAMSLTGPGGPRWRVLLRRVGGGRRRREGGGRGSGERSVDEGRNPGPNRPRRGGDRPMEAMPRGLTLAAWTPLEPLEADLRALAVALGLTSLGLWVLAAALGRHFGRRALAPLVHMAETARSLPWPEGGPRLPSPGTHDELEDFAASFNGLIERLNEALQRQRQFTGQASHQLRTPLAGLIATVEVARRRPRSAHEHERTLDRVHADALRLWRIVEAMLFLARADTESALPDLELLDLAAWTPEHLAAWSSHPRASDIQWSEGAGPLPVRAHPALLGQLLDNLLENACKYSAPGRPIAVAAWSEPGLVALSVEDYGPGIAPDDLARIFQPFHRSSSVQSSHTGVGLGLAVVQRIAAAHGGTVTAQSELGRGSRFVLRLPAGYVQARLDSSQASLIDRAHSSSLTRP
jgi:signal transduction histidine kinase